MKKRNIYLLNISVYLSYCQIVIPNNRREGKQMNWSSKQDFKNRTMCLNEY